MSTKAVFHVSFNKIRFVLIALLVVDTFELISNDGAHQQGVEEV